MKRALIAFFNFWFLLGSLHSVMLTSSRKIISRRLQDDSENSTTKSSEFPLLEEEENDPSQVNDNFSASSPLEHDKRYVEIRENIKKRQDEYDLCLNSISDNDFSDEKVDACVGVDYNFLKNDIDFEKSRILSIANFVVKDIFVLKCFLIAGIDLVVADGCDLLQKDVLTLLWSELNFEALVDFHRTKYLSQHAFLTEELFNNIMRELKPIQYELSSLLTEMYDYRTLTIQHFEESIGGRAQDIIERYNNRDPNMFAGRSGITTIHIDLGNNDRALNKNEKESKLSNLQDKPSILFFKKNNKKNLQIRSNKVVSSKKETKTREAELTKIPIS